MANTHYYSKDVNGVKSEPKTFEFYFKNKKFIFDTDNGVFSKDFVDFGSHVMLENFKPNDLLYPILDMGAGYGVLGIILGTTYNKEVYLSEINERAYNLIIKNIKNNNCSNMHPLNGNLYETVEDKIFSSIITNPPIRAGKSVVFSIYEGAYNHLCDGGELWVVIQKKQGEESSKKKIEELFGNCEIVKRDKGYYILKAQKKL